jgi:hypothetical protein
MQTDGKMLWRLQCKSNDPISLSIGHSLIPCDLGAELDVGQAGEAAPDDRVARWRVRSSREVSAKSSELCQIEDQRAGLGRATVAGPSPIGRRRTVS